MDTWRQSNNTEKWTKAQAILYQVRTSGVYSQIRSTSSAGVQPVQTMAPGSYGSTMVFPATSTGRYDPYALPRAPPPPVSAAAVPSVSKPAIRFKPSPFFRIDQPVSGIAECPESTSSTDRKQQSLTFTLNSEQTAKLGSTSTKYQLRLYCTTSTFHNPSPTVFRPPAGPCLIEFPPTCEVRVNGTALQANLKGLKKKPGTAPPADLGQMVRMSGQNRVEMVYVNSQQPVQPKKFYMVVFLVEVTTVAQLVDRLKKGKYRSSQDVLAMMFKPSNDDDEIVAGPQKMSLKCPLSFMRVQTPSRSILCVHPQCFDATSWFSCMEQTTTWLCPVCEKVLNPDDLIIDGYFDQILKETSEDVDDVVVENDGQWHTNDHKYASPEWRATHPAIAPQHYSPPRESSPASVDEEADAKAHAKKQVEILVLDSDDEDEGRVKRELSISYSVGSSSIPKPVFLHAMLASQESHREDVIDLTADSEDEQPRSQSSSQPQPLRPSVEKRKTPSGAPSPTEQIWKKSRVDAITNPQPVPSALPPISPAGGAARPPIHCGAAGQLPQTAFAGPPLPPLRLPPTTYVGQAGGGYMSPVGASAGEESHRGGFGQYNGNYSYGSQPGGPMPPRSGVWP
ncbi:PINIT domain-containing protein [Boletus edulis BED1]|uniref:PINIT domain-containing protein n=1 Tax=Boletus edulis BED1 TaxID=1328754 RepID=A0AAD4C1C0_BOLED|nr:PINIT domain-containing protein [Boletus edulis BED1]